nr:reverse transcriptase domain-containing protein [Tanacetum cinerariifolium]
QKGGTFRSITSSSPEIAALTHQIAEMNKNFLRISKSNQQVNVVNPSCETCGDPHHYSDCQATGGFTQGDVYVATGNYNAGGGGTRPEDDHGPCAHFKFRKYRTSPISALAQMPKYTKMLKDLLTNKEKLIELANNPLNENFLAVLFKKLPEKLRDPRKFLIPCDFSEPEECLALADLGASINLMPLYVLKKLMLLELIPTRRTLELANRSVAYSVGIAKDVFVQVVDVHGEELTLRVGDEKLIFNVKSTSKYPYMHRDESINQIDITDTTCEDHFHKVLNVQKLIHPLSGIPTPFDPGRVSLPSLTPFVDSDFLLEETDAFLALDDSIPPEIDNEIYDSEGDILFLENLLNDDPTKDLPPKELKNDENKMTKSSIEEPPKL